VKNQNKSLANQRIGSLNLVIKDKLTNNIDLNRVFSKVNHVLPDHILSLIDIVYIGDFNFLKEKNVNAVYMDGAIYVSNTQDSDGDLLDDIIHEFSHAAEEKYNREIYEDSEVRNEFLRKRAKLKNILIHQDYKVEHLDFLNTEYDSEFDSMMYEDIGYDALNILTIDLFLSPYSVTSLREYFATGFEEKYIGDDLYFKEICPYLYSKVILLHNNEEEYEF